MPIFENQFSEDGCSGVVADTFQDLDEIQDRIETFLRENLPLCSAFLPGTKDGSVKIRGEKELAVSLCKRLVALAYDKKVVFTFFNEDPDKRAKNRTLDMSIIPSVGTALIKVGPHFYDCEDQLYAIEAKRLPAPSRIGQEDRSREYVVSDWGNCKLMKKNRTGGIERFKEGLHGHEFKRSAMVAFVQREKPDRWFGAVNSWIQDLITSPIPCHRSKWTKDDLLLQISSDPNHGGLSEFESSHLRTNGAGTIKLRHYWIMLN